MSRRLLAGAIALSIWALPLPARADTTLARGQRVVVERSSSRPDWVEKRSWQAEGRHYFVGASGTVSDLSLGEEIAELNAKKVIASALSEEIESAVDLAVAGRPDAERLDRAISSTVRQRTDKVRVKGVVPVERYWERLEVGTGNGVKTVYEVTLLMAVPDRVFAAAEDRELEALSREPQIREDSEAMRLLEQLRKQP
ncbi:MAG: hypothetical protein VKP72_07345 [bacterium]|nr:hypothetical protein [bacterium]